MGIVLATVRYPTDVTVLCDPSYGIQLGKGRAVALHDDYSDFLIDQLQGLGPVDLVRFFGGRALKQDGLQFAFIVADTLYFTVDDQTRPDYEARGMAHFSYMKGGKEIPVRKYYEVPSDILDDADDLTDWARAALGAALRTRK